MTIKEVKKGDYIRLSDKPNAKTYTRGEYDRELKKYHLIDHTDIYGNGIYKKGNTEVLTDFIY